MPNNLYKTFDDLEQSTSNNGIYAPLPLRVRSVFEILDCAIRVYKRYFWAIVTRSALAGIAMLFFLVGATTMSIKLLFFWLIAIFVLWPWAVAVPAAYLMAAVRGQNRISWCGSVAAQRYAALLFHLFVCGFIFFVPLVLWMIVNFVFGDSTTEPIFVQILLGGILLALVIPIGTCFAWLNLALLVAYFEEVPGRLLTLGRAFALLNGNWIRVTVLAVFLGLMCFALGGVLVACSSVISMVCDYFDLLKHTPIGSTQEPAWFGLLGSIDCTIAAMTFIPIWYLALGLFYLDVRVRKEGLDIEWNAQSVGNSVAIETTTVSAQSH